MSFRRILLVLPLVLLLLAVLLFFAAEYWFESAGGRGSIETTLSQSAGMPVRLDGDFDIMFLPSPGVRGTGLSISDPVSGDEVARSQMYEVELALGPLFRQELEVNHLALQKLVLGARGGPRFAIPRIAVSGFSPGSATDFEIDLGWLGRVDGVFTWRPAQADVALDLAWAGEGREDIELAGNIHYFTDYLRFDQLAAVIGGQALTGQGCLLQLGPPVLNLELEAGVLDLNALLEGVPGGQGGTGMLPLDVNLVLRATEIRRGDVRAVDTVLEIGAAPQCP